MVPTKFNFVNTLAHPSMGLIVYSKSQQMGTNIIWDEMMLQMML